MAGLPGSFVIEDDERTTALTAVEHSVFYEVEGKREQLFRGYGGSRPKLARLSAGHVVIAYCGGSILKVQSSFFADQSKSADLIRLQVVTDAGLSADGHSIC